MEKKIHIFKSFEEQEAYHLEKMRKSTIKERFRQLYLMQQMTKLLHPSKDSERKIIIKMELLDKEFLLFFSCAQQNKLRYMIIGGYAVNYYGL